MAPSITRELVLFELRKYFEKIVFIRNIMVAYAFASVGLAWKISSDPAFSVNITIVFCLVTTSTLLFLAYGLWANSPEWRELLRKGER